VPIHLAAFNSGTVIAIKPIVARNLQSLVERTQQGSIDTNTGSHHSARYAKERLRLWSRGGSPTYGDIKALHPSRTPRIFDILYQQYPISLAHRYTIEDRISQGTSTISVSTNKPNNQTISLMIRDYPMIHTYGTLIEARDLSLGLIIPFSTQLQPFFLHQGTAELITASAAVLL